MIQAVGAAPYFDTESVLGRRVIAWLVDLVLVSLLIGLLDAVLAVLGFVTFGIGWALLWLMPLVPFAYSFLSLASRHAATPGQRLLGLTVVEHSTGRRPTAFEALVSTLVFVALLATIAPLFLIALLTPRNRAPQDLIAGLLMVRQAPLTVRHGAWNMAPGTSP
jgi:uncharacterized RDD family membrane protein YckC